MKKNYFLTVILMASLSIHAIAQLPIGHKSLSYQDPARSNRNVTTEIYYPATSAGDNKPFATGQFPTIVFGHGFVMGYDAYAYFKNAIVPLGYIIVFATTEGSMSPNHSEFGADLAFLINQMQSEGAYSSSFFYNHVSPESAIMGHSMGGGSSFLACQNNTIPTCMVTFAAANTSPVTSVTAAQDVLIPALVISGGADCVAAPATNQIPMYDSLASACKVYISINDGCHCYFADYNFNCAFGEGTCNPVPALPRTNQQDATLDFVKLYLDYYLKGNASSWSIFNDSLSSSPRITHQESCATTTTDEIYRTSLSVWPNPTDNLINITFVKEGNYSLKILDFTGKTVTSESSDGVLHKSIDISKLSAGLYMMEISSGTNTFHKKIIKK